MSANNMQIGGSHYQSGYQHWDLIEEHGIGYLEAAASKYVTRWRRKDGRKDLEKALHYTDKLIELHKRGVRPPRGVASAAAVKRFGEINKLTVTERSVVHWLCRWSDLEHLEIARSGIVSLLSECDTLPARTSGQDNPHGFNPKDDIYVDEMQRTLKQSYVACEDCRNRGSTGCRHPGTGHDGCTRDSHYNSDIGRGYILCADCERLQYVTCHHPGVGHAGCGRDKAFAHDKAAAVRKQ